MRFYKFENCVVNLNNIRYIKRETPIGLDPYYSIHFLDQGELAISEEAYEQLILYLKKYNDIMR